jgi:hypothetical protein
MNRVTKSVVGVGATLALSVGGGLSTASADDPAPKYPVVHPWEPYDTHDTLPAGSACKAEVRIHEKGNLRATEVSKTETRIEWKDWSFGTFTAVTYPYGIKRTTSVTVSEGGDSVERDRGNGVIDITVEGANVFLGPGIKGIRYGEGDARFVITGDGTPDMQLRFIKKPHKLVELCKLLGTSPVRGRFMAPPTTSDATRASAPVKARAAKPYGMAAGR